MVHPLGHLHLTPFPFPPSFPSSNPLLGFKTTKTIFFTINIILTTLCPRSRITTNTLSVFK